MLLFEVVTIGNELLAGDVVDTNAGLIGVWATRTGHRVHRRQTVPDDIAAIVDALTLAISRSDWIVVSGGLGPTKDDLTTEAAAKLLSEPLVCDNRSLRRILERFAQRGIPCPENNYKQALFPQSAVVIDNPVGTAPAFELRTGGRRIFFLPGVHREFRAILEHHIVAELSAAGHGQSQFLTLRLFGATESAIGLKLQDVDLQPDELIQYRVKFPEILVTPVIQHGDAARLTTIVDNITARISDVLYATGDAPLAEVVGQILRERSWTIAVAESCTGGLLGELLTAVPGSSAYVISGVIAYSNDAKQDLLGVSAATLENHGAVSEPTVTEMVHGIRRISKADVGVAISGIAGPGGGSVEKPVGTVYIGVKVMDTPTHVVRYQFPGNREWVRVLAAWTALDMVRRIALGIWP